MRSSICNLSVLVCSLAIWHVPNAAAQVDLYDNLDNVRSNDDWITANGSNVRYAQQFLLGDETNIDEVTVLLQRNRPAAKGNLRFELWRDNGSNQPMPPDDPTGKIADLGKVLNVDETVPVGEFGRFTFDNLVLGLEPNQPYWVLVDYAEVTNIQFNDESLGIALAFDDPNRRPTPPDYDATAGTHGATDVHWYRNSTQSWVNLRAEFGAIHLYQAVKVEAMEEHATESVLRYDNTNASLNVGERIFPFQSPHNAAVAQAFNVGDYDNISSIDVSMSRIGDSQGTVEVSIWNDSGNGIPGQRIAALGSVEVSALEDVGDLPTTLPVVTFDATVAGLTPNETYFIVLQEDMRGSVTGSQTFLKGALFSNEGTNAARELLLTNPPNSDNWDSSANIFGDRRYLQMAVNSASLLGDFNESGQLDAIDMDMLSSQFRRVPDDRSFDLNNDGTLTQADREIWVHDVANTDFGDSNLDGEFNSDDLTVAFQLGEYEDNITLNSTWAEGDWNGDGDFNADDLAFVNTLVGDSNIDGTVDFSDFLVLSAGFGNPGGWDEGDFDGNGQVEFPDFLALSANFGESAVVAASVPEPSAMAMLIIGLLGVGGRRRFL